MITAAWIHSLAKLWRRGFVGEAIPRTLWLTIVLALVFLFNMNAHISPDTVLAQNPLQETGDKLAWDIQTVDAPKSFGGMGDKSLRLDANNNPHVAYGGDHLYYDWREGTTWHSEIVDAGSAFGSYATLALDANGNPHISYYDAKHGTLKYARRAGNSWEIQTVDRTANVGKFSSLALDTFGNPHISYFDESGGDLKYARWTGTRWAIETVDSAGLVGVGSTSLALDSLNNPHISYYKWGSGPYSGILGYAYRKGSAWVIESVEKNSDSGWDNSLVLDSADNPIICYTDSVAASKSNLECAFKTTHRWMIEIVDSSGGRLGQDVSLALDQTGNPRVGYYAYDPDGDLKYAYRTPSGWNVQVVDSDGDVGANSSLALDSSGNPHLTYSNNTHSDLKYAYWIQGNWTIETIEKGGTVGTSTSLALDASDNPHVSYDEYPTGGIKYASWNGSTWSVQSLDPNGAYSSLALDTNAAPHISYCFYWANYIPPCNELRYAHYTGGNWEFETVASGGWLGEYNSLALDNNGNPHISYFDFTGTALKYAYKTGANWNIETIDAGVLLEQATSLALDAQGNPHVSYAVTYDYDVQNNVRDLRYAHRTANGWVVETVDGDGFVGMYSSLALDQSGKPHISYFDRTQDALKYASRTGKRWVTEIVDASGSVGKFTSLALDSGDRAHISYQAQDRQALKYARQFDGGWTIQTIDKTDDVGRYGSLAVGRTGSVHITYHDTTNGDLKYAVGSLACTEKPNPPVLINPTNGADIKNRRALLDWSNANCAAHYSIMVRENATNGQVVIRRDDLTLSRYKTIRLTRGQTYYWRARACNALGCTEWTTYRKFQIQSLGARQAK